MVRKSRNVNITAANVAVNGNRSGGRQVVPRERSRKRGNVQKLQREVQLLDPRMRTSSGNELVALEQMNSGRMTDDSLSDMSFIRSLRNGRCAMDTNTEGWYFKYLDPAGSVETARAIGEFSKIPDGLLTFSVDAEIRTIDTLPVPLLEAEVDGPGHIPLDGATWSLTIFSYPMFRTAYIAVANRFDKEISQSIASELAFTLNNLTDYRATIDSDTWAPFAIEEEEGWFYWIKPLPPTYNLVDPVVGDQRTLTSWRMAYKSLTIEHNAPTLIDQGFWNGGHYALDPTSVQQQGPQTQMVSSWLHGRATLSWSALAAARYSLRIPNLPPVAIASGPAIVNTLSDHFYIIVMGDSNLTPITWVIAPGQTWYNPFEVVFAEPGDVVTMSATGFVIGGTTVTLTSSAIGSTPIVLTFLADPNNTANVVVNTEALADIYVDISASEFPNRDSNQIEFPAYNPSQIAANNPKMEQFLMKETNGAYVVHKKMRKPVFEVTPAGSFGPIQFTTPGYLTSRNTDDGSGILDTIDANFSTASVCIRGIAHANVPVVKLYQGWEGITNVNTPFGQFGHTGLPRNDCVMELVDNLTVRTTGVYPANDNFLGLIAKFAAGALKSLLSSEATPAMLGNLAQGVINKGLNTINNGLDNYSNRR